MKHPLALASALALLSAPAGANPISVPIAITGGGVCYAPPIPGAAVANILLLNTALAGSVGFTVSGANASLFAVSGEQVVNTAAPAGTYSITVSATAPFVLTCVCTTAACAGG